MRVALTQARGRLERLDGALRTLGHEPVRVPLIATEALRDPDAAAQAHALVGLPWRLYASRSAVEAWRALGLGYGDRATLGAVGPGTRRALVGEGAMEVLVGDPPTAAGLADVVTRAAATRREIHSTVGALAERDGPDAIGVVQGRRARPTLRNLLEDAGFDVRVATLYDTVAQVWPADLEVDAVVVASPSAVEALPRHVGDRVLLVAIGPTTDRAALRRGWRALRAATPTAEGIAEALEARTRTVTEGVDAS